jgi:hypothetical protein
VGWPRRCSPERKGVITPRPNSSRGSGRKHSEAADWCRGSAERLSARWVPYERDKSEGGNGGFLKPWRLGGAGRGKGVPASASAWREKEGVKGGGPSAVVSCTGWPAAAPGRQARAVPLLHDRGGRWLWAMWQTWLTSGTGVRRDPVSATECGSMKGREARWRQGTNTRARATQHSFGRHSSNGI